MTPPRIAYFISSHGYGHAARASAIMAALANLEPTIQFEIFTHVPRHFFADSLAQPFAYHPILTDIGLAQHDSLREDLPGTVERLASFWPFDPALVESLARQVKQQRCRLVLCDISPLGIAVAQAAGLPAVLVENFTWDWIYQGYVSAEPRLGRYITALQGCFAAADYHIQTEPVCHPNSPHLTTRPISRPSRTPAAEIRQKLGLPGEAKMVLLTMGGIPWEYTFLEKLTGFPDCYFVIPGSGVKQPEQHRHLTLLPHDSAFYHPDLIKASDVVIGKLGYSTLAEVYHAGQPFGYIPRPHFRESARLAAYVEQSMPGLAITPTQFESGDWVLDLPRLLAQPRLERREANGADQAAQFIARLLDEN